MNDKLRVQVEALMSLCNRDIEGQFEEVTGSTFEALRALATPSAGLDAPEGLRTALVAVDVALNSFGEPLCAHCHHGHTEAAWSDRDPDDGTCWNAGTLVCGCPKFITPAVKEIRGRRLATRPESKAKPHD